MRGEKRTEKEKNRRAKRKEQEQEQKRSTIRTEREQREREKREIQEYKTESVIRSLPIRSIQKTEAREKEIAKKYQIEGSNRKRTD